jgi:DNA repair protein RecN (Recombination protein N)
MLQRIQINNYAIIDSLGIDFSQRLNVITGETGAGKSILMGALSLILGDRADTAVLLQRDKKCVVEGVFSLEKRKGALAFFQADDLDITDNEIVIRREIAPSGKSRAFVNDTPVNLEQLRRLSSLLVDLHRQFDTLELGESDFQREVLDALAGQAVALGAYQAGYREWQVASRELTSLRDQQAKFTKEFDYHKFLFDELHEAGFKENELEELDQELKLLNNSEGIKTALSKISYDLQEGEQPLVQQLRTLGHLLANFSAYHAELAVLSERMSSAQIELQDIAGEVERINEEVNYDPKRIETINERLSMGYKLMKKARGADDGGAAGDQGAVGAQTTGFAAGGCGHCGRGKGRAAIAAGGEEAGGGVEQGEAGGDSATGDAGQQVAEAGRHAQCAAQGGSAGGGIECFGYGYHRVFV